MPKRSSKKIMPIWYMAIGFFFGSIGTCAGYVYLNNAAIGAAVGLIAAVIVTKYL